ncbi:MAG: hypothetical protein LBS49_13950, partial [Candidatus Accumulibacter sp.]|nr:hypothetical protein [Accumulibacter sp.]
MVKTQGMIKDKRGHRQSKDKRDHRQFMPSSVSQAGQSHPCNAVGIVVVFLCNAVGIVAFFLGARGFCPATAGMTRPPPLRG